jgi:hypothetical protein
VNLGFNRSASLADPERLLMGGGARIRHVRIAAAADLARRGVRALIRAAVAEGREARRLHEKASAEMTPGATVAQRGQ